MTKDPIRPEIEQLIEAHLEVLCCEIAEWRSTGVLARGKLRELAAVLVVAEHGESKIHLAEQLVADAAIRRVAVISRSRSLAA